MEPILYQSSSNSDHRGTVSFTNELDLNKAIPKNYANGAMNLSENNSIRYLSSLPLEESINDDYRFDSQFWDPWSKFNPNLYE